MMGGDITVESVLGEGSRFTVWLSHANADGQLTARRRLAL